MFGRISMYVWIKKLLKWWMRSGLQIQPQTGSSRNHWKASHVTGDVGNAASITMMYLPQWKLAGGFLYEKIEIITYREFGYDQESISKEWIFWMDSKLSVMVVEIRKSSSNEFEEFNEVLNERDKRVFGFNPEEEGKLERSTRIFGCWRRNQDLLRLVQIIR